MNDRNDIIPNPKDIEKKIRILLQAVSIAWQVTY